MTTEVVDPGEAVERVRWRLARVRSLVARLGPGRLGVPAARFESLLLGYDLYARMLDDALAEAESR